MLQDGRECVRLIGTFGDLAHADGPTRVLREPPPWPPVDELDEPLRRARPGMLPEFLDRLDHRLPDATSGWTRGEPSGAGVHGGWCRWSDHGDMDVLGLLCIADAYPPVVYDLDIGGLAWAPTIELTVQVRGRPAPGWLATRFVTRSLTDGYFEEDGDLWDAEGRLVALSRQLALAGRASRAQG